MLNFETIERYFDVGLWTAAMVQNAVVKGKITQEQCGAIVGATASAQQ